MKAIFLDIDGVMNSEQRLLELKKLQEEGKLSEKALRDRWDLPYEGTLVPLKRIVDTTGAIIVLSSSWRVGGWDGMLVKRLVKCFEPYSLTITDFTPKGVSLERLKEIGFDPDNCYDAKYRNDSFGESYKEKTWDRGAEIASWLSKHKDVTSFVIFDDDWLDIIPYYEDHFVQTSFYDNGLTEEKADEAIAILNK